MQEAEYQNRKEGMATGWRKEEIWTVGTAAREEREKGKERAES